jgi:Pyruvate/2-oxoacid:ferredoxin oxidoreductase delta subunit
MGKKLEGKRVRIVLYEGDGARPLDKETRFDTMVALLDDGHPVTRSAVGGNVAPSDGSNHLVLGQFERTPVHDAGGSLEFIDISGLAATDVRDKVRERVAAVEAEAPGAWKPWFPVIDYDRCTNCMQCLTFCLFDVYGVDGDQKIQVQIQDNCKTDCPACSRVCPEAAILFPKYKAGPINGDVVREEDLKRESMKVDISALLGGDIYAALRERSKTARERFSTERDESKALLERKRCLKKLQKTLDIPNEVLMTLPSVGDIEDRARRAKEKAERRKTRSQSMQDRKATPEDWGI